MNPNSNQLGENRSFGGVLAWMNDIEVHVGAYLAAALFLIVGIFLINQPLFEVTVPILGANEITASMIPGLQWAKVAVAVLNLAALFMLIFPMLKFFEWKYRWFLPVLAVFAVEAAASIAILMMKEKIVGDSVVNAAMELFSIEITATVYTWLFLAVSVLGVGTALKLVLDIKKNKTIYMYE